MTWQWLFNKLDEIGSNPSQFADAIGWQKSRVYELSNGRTKKIPNRYLLKAAEYLKIDLEDLLLLNDGKTLNNIPKTINNFSPTNIDTLNISEDKFIEIISTAFDVFYECLSKNPKEIKNIGQKMAEICLSATKVDTTDRKGQMQAMVVNLYTKKAS